MTNMKRIYYLQRIILSVLLLLPLSGCFDSDINRKMYEADDSEMQRENHIVGATLRVMQGLVSPTREHLYQFMDAMVGGAYGGYMEGIVDTWVMKFSTFNPEQGWLKSPFADPITDLYPQYLKMLSVTDDPVALALGKMLEQPREMGEMTLKDFVPMSLRCQMRSNRKSGKCKEKQNIAGERFANHYPRRCKI